MAFCIEGILLNKNPCQNPVWLPPIYNDTSLLPTGVGVAAHVRKKSNSLPFERPRSFIRMDQHLIMINVGMHKPSMTGNGLYMFIPPIHKYHLL